jgi:hypothetical protein
MEFINLKWVGAFNWWLVLFMFLDLNFVHFSCVPCMLHTHPFLYSIIAIYLLLEYNCLAALGSSTPAAAADVCVTAQQRQQADVLLKL